MKVPFSWLKEFVDIDVTAQELEEKLFSCGFEVEELIPLDAGISKVVVGKIVEMEKQEGTHLTKCVVDCGDYGHDIRISTGAANMKLGDCVPAALDGSTLPGGIKIKARKMQGVESNGMLCSGEELGLNDDLFPGSEVYGLLILPEDSVPGTDIAPVVGLDDYIFDISITANRPDCQSVLGIAREVAAILGKPLHMPAMDYKTVCEPDAPINVQVEAPDLCPRYMAHYVRNIRMGESPRWMKRHLALCGLRSISNVVDITNHTLLEMGQPMHAFDLDQVRGRKILVRRAKDGEEVSYNPPRYEYSYDFYITIFVNNPYFNEMRFQVNSSSIDITPPSARPGMPARCNPETNVEYRNCKKLGEEIRQALTQVRKDVREKIEQAAAPKAAVTCPYCGATTTPDASGCCEYCGGAVNG